METAIAYIRVSDPKQVVDGNSLATQEIQVRTLADHRQYTFDRLFVEPGESAKTDDRPVLQEMLRYCRAKKGKIQVLIVPKIDRLARNAYDYAGLKVQLSKLGIRLESVGERIEDSPVGRFTETILASVAQFDNEIRAERSRGGMLQAIMEGRWIFVAPYGYRNVRRDGKSNVEPNPAEAETVTDIFARLAAGARPTDVLTLLTKKGIPFTRSHFFKVIRNPAYIGIVQAFGQTVRAAPPFVPLVSREVFQAAQESIRRKQIPPTYDRDNPDFPLRGTIRCECGNFLTAGWSSGRVKRYAFYRCLTCQRVNLPREEVHRFFCCLLRARRLLPAAAERLRSSILTTAKSSQADHDAELRQLNLETTKVRELRKGIATKNALGVIPDDLAKEQLQELDGELLKLELRRTKSLPPVDDLEAALDFAVKFLANLPTFWLNASTQNQKLLQRFVYPDGFPFARNGNFRTAKNGRLTGSKILSQPKLSSMVHQHNETPSLWHAGNKRMTANQKMEFVLEAYRLFGKPLAPGRQPTAFSSR